MTAPPRLTPLVLLLFIGSGAAALIYEVVWLQMLQLVIGSSAVSLAVLLGTFMGGMGLGSLALPRFLPATVHPLRAYAALEFGIAAAGLLVLVAMPAVASLYTTLVGHGLSGVSLRATVCLVCLLPPTMLMGATLPAVSRWLETTPRGVAWLGGFYGANTAGAVAGCLFAGFYLLRVHDRTTATLVAVGLNLAVGLLALVLARVTPRVTATPAGAVAAAPASLASTAGAPARSILGAIALSGFCALAAEVVWTRLLSLLLGATVYTFALILAVFLAGLGLGSSLGALVGRCVAHPRRVFALGQFLQALALAWAAYAIAVVLPYWSVDPALAATTTAKFLDDILRCTVAILPSALLWGASFPLALASAATAGADPARLVGRIYAANTLGAIVGAVLASLVFIPLLGTRLTQQALVLASWASAALLLRPRTRGGWALLAASLGLASAVYTWLPGIPWQLVAYGRQTATTDYGASALYVGEGMNASVVVSQTGDGARYFHVSGKTEASSLIKDMRLQRMLGHLPALFHPQPKSVLIVGCGAGVTAGTFVLHPTIERIVICDIEPLIPEIVATHFRHENHDVLRDPRVTVVHDDARHYIATTQEKFDLITSDPIHPWVKGSAVLYSREYFDLCRQRLNPGGFMTQWVPLYESDRAVVQSELATFFSVFPHGTIWANDDDGYGYDTVLLGQAEPLRLDLNRLEERLERRDHAPARAALAELGLGSVVDLLSTYTGRGSELRPWLARAAINHDRTLRLQYLAGLQLNSASGTATYEEMLSYRTFPDDLITASPARRAQLHRALGFPPSP